MKGRFTKRMSSKHFIARESRGTSLDSVDSLRVWKVSCWNQTFQIVMFNLQGLPMPISAAYKAILQTSYSEASYTPKQHISDIQKCKHSESGMFHKASPLPGVSLWDKIGTLKFGTNIYSNIASSAAPGIGPSRRVTSGRAQAPAEHAQPDAGRRPWADDQLKPADS